VPSLQIAYVWHASVFTREVLNGLLRIGFLYPQQIIWNKGRTVLTRTHYWYQHEPCWYVRKKNAPWFGRPGENSTIWDSPSPKFIMGGSAEDKFDHPTQKPVELMRRPILNHTRRGESVYEPFLGSGTTLAAAELTERVCLGMEIDPKYVDVVIKRWQQLTGEQAVLEGDGRTFEEISAARKLAAARTFLRYLRREGLMDDDSGTLVPVNTAALIPGVNERITALMNATDCPSPVTTGFHSMPRPLVSAVGVGALAGEGFAYTKKLFPRAKVRLGGIYASLMPEHAKQSGADEVFVGTDDALDSVVPDYDSIPEWTANLVFTSRGCIRKCKFCAVPAIEPVKSARNSFIPLLDHRFNKIIFWDNNFFGTPNWREILEEIRERNLIVDFNQGIDARLVTEEVAERLSGIKIAPVRMAYDTFNTSFRRAMERAVRLLGEAGFRKRNMMVYVLHNFTDTPHDFFQRVRDLLNWGVVAYPMRFEPLQSLEKNVYVARQNGWTEDYLNLIARARRVIGFGGAFPPYEGLRKKIDEAANFEEAFRLRPVNEQEKENFSADSELVSMGDDHQFPVSRTGRRSAVA